MWSRSNVSGCFRSHSMFSWMHWRYAAVFMVVGTTTPLSLQMPLPPKAKRIQAGAFRDVLQLRAQYNDLDKIIRLHQPARRT